MISAPATYRHGLHQSILIKYINMMIANRSNIINLLEKEPGQICNRVLILKYSKGTAYRPYLLHITHGTT